MQKYIAIMLKNSTSTSFVEYSLNLMYIYEVNQRNVLAQFSVNSIDLCCLRYTHLCMP